MKILFSFGLHGSGDDFKKTRPLLDKFLPNVIAPEGYTNTYDARKKFAVIFAKMLDLCKDLKGSAKDEAIGIFMKELAKMLDLNSHLDDVLREALNAGAAFFPIEAHANGFDCDEQWDEWGSCLSETGESIRDGNFGDAVFSYFDGWRELAETQRAREQAIISNLKNYREELLEVYPHLQDNDLRVFARFGIMHSSLYGRARREFAANSSMEFEQSFDDFPVHFSKHGYIVLRALTFGIAPEPEWVFSDMLYGLRDIENAGWKLKSSKEKASEILVRNREKMLLAIEKELDTQTILLLGSGNRLGSKKAILLEKLNQNSERAGIRRIFIEEGETKGAKEYALLYNYLVDLCTKQLKEAKISTEDEEGFIKEVSNILFGKLEFGLSNKISSLRSALLLREWDCDTISFLVFDIGKRFGIDLSVVWTTFDGENHSLVRTKNFYFETTATRKDGLYYFPAHQFSDFFGSTYLITSDAARMQAMTYYDIGNKKMEKGLYEEALKSIDEALKLDPKNPQLIYSLATCYFHLKDFERAKSEFESALELDPQHHRTLANLGALYAMEGDIARASDYLRQSISINENTKETHYNLGLMLEETGDYAGAHLCYGSALTIDPRYEDALFASASLYFLEEDYARATQDFTMLLGIEETSERFFNRGLCHSRSGKRHESLADYTASLRLDPGNIDALINRGYLYTREELRNYELALADFAKVLEINPQEADAHYALSLVYDELGMKAEAERNLQMYNDLKSGVSNS